MAIDTPKLIPTAPKSNAAKAMTLGTFLDLQNNPLGHGKGENFNVPSNYAIPPARIYVINHSRTRKRREIAIPVSAQRGAEEALIYDKELAKIYNVDTLTRRIEQGKDMNRYVDRVNPVIFKIQIGSPVGGAKPVVYGIAPAKEDATQPPKVEVLEGVWDLFLGNYARMRGYETFAEMGTKEPDPSIIGAEKTRHSTNWSLRHNPILRYSDDGETFDFDNKFGYLEIVRETVVPTTEVFDREYLDSLSITEAM